MNSHFPYEDLYIYLVKGEVSETHEVVFGDAFIGNWVEDDTAFLFFSKPSMHKVKAIIESREDLEYIEEHHFTYEQWQGGFLGPIRIEPLLIVPPWVEENPEPGGIKITLDPGVVFGTGLHPTTKDCLKALVTLQEWRTPMERVLDLGTGTGILALAAGFLGAREITAVDLNPLAVKTTQKNVHLNHLEKIIKVIQGQAQDFSDQPADLVIANIHHKVILELLETEGFRQKSRFIISGLMRSQVTDLREHFQKYELEVLLECDHDMTWYTLVLARS